MKFTITYNNQSVSVELLAPNSDLYSLEFPNKRVQFIALIKNIRNQSCWTSIPHGNEDMATDIGKLIEEHIQKSKKEQ